jgi:hypothetical protein
MNQHKIAEYTFLGLDNHGKSTGGAPGLAYLIGLVDSPTHEITQPLAAKRILAWLFDEEEQVRNADELFKRQVEFFTRYFPRGYFPQTPCMLTKSWSPIGAMLQRGLAPVGLWREEKIRAVATGVWEPTGLADFKSSKDCVTVEDLFWGVLGEAFTRARQRKMWVSVIAKPGWCYESKIGSLGKWSGEEIAKADRIIWMRTPEG